MSASGTHAQTNGRPAGATIDRAAIHSYHGQPVLKEPVWTWEIPCYFFTGGLGGASAGLAFLAELRGEETLARRAWTAALAGVTVSPVLLISDLGRPLRFLNMLRMVKITSPMSIGSWILVASGATTTVATAHTYTGLLPGLAKVARPAAALLGLPLSTYTAALVANTAVPVWHEARLLLPFVFGSGAALSAGSVAVAVNSPAQAGAARRLALGSAALELGLNEAMKRRLGGHGEPYSKGAAKWWGRASMASLVTGAGLLATAGRGSQAAAAIAGAVLAAGALSARWSVFKAGFISAADPKYVVDPQRAAIEHGTRRGASRSQSKVSAVQAQVGSPATALKVTDALASNGPPPS